MTLYRQLHNSKTHAQGNDPNCPVCQRHIQVADALSDVNARRVCDLPGPNDSDMTFYMLPNGQPIVHNYAKDAGFEIYATISHSNRTKVCSPTSLCNGSGSSYGSNISASGPITGN